MLIRNKEGAICGRVRKILSARKMVLIKNLWDEVVAAIPYSDSATWPKNLAGNLAEYGYCADPVE